ncbi:MAG: translation initiation factor IF-2 [Clostridiales bacterium]|nr:translation initiation factor IF-2 [Clostridiales bacterium]
MSEKDKKFEAIRQLRDKSATELPELFKDIKETKKQIDSILARLKEKEQEFASVKAESKDVVPPPEPEMAAPEEAHEIKAEEKFAEAMEEPKAEEKSDVTAETAEAQAAAEEKQPEQKQKTEKKKKKGKTAEQRFFESLPKPVSQENKRFIDLSAASDKKEKPRQKDAKKTKDKIQIAKKKAPEQKPAERKTVKSFAPPPAPVTASKPSSKKKDKDINKGGKKEKGLNKRTLIRRGFLIDDDNIIVDGNDEYRMGSKKIKIKKKDSGAAKAQEAPKIEKAVVTSDVIPIKTLSDKLGIPAVEITKRLFKDGIIKTINENIDYETAALLAADMGIELELKMEKTAEDILAELVEAESLSEGELIKRAPIVTVMGHVDHGKTTLLDYIRQTNVVAGEAGGITQQIGAYTITVKGEMITFIDTPGHEAFTAMRARGAQITDVTILVVAADDGIMPQTIEAINHAKAANVPIIVAINKIDKPTANPDRIMQQLTEHGLVPEEWGGDAIICPVSALTGQGIDHLLEMILLVAEVRELKANPYRKARGTILEAKLDKGMGPVATVIVQDGTLHVGDSVIAGAITGRVRAMFDDKGKGVKEAGPSFAVSVLGFSGVPNAGDPVFALDNEKLSRLVAEERLEKFRDQMTKSAAKVSLDDVFSKIAEGQVKGLNVIIKGDLQGSVEAISQALLKLGNDEVRINIIHGGVGAISESDIMLAQTASAIVIGFNVRPETKAKQLAEKENVDIRLYRIIYDVIDDVEKAMKGMLEPKFREVQLGQAEIRETFKISGIGVVAGCYVLNGKVAKNAKIRLLRDNVVLMEGEIASLKRFKDDVREVAQGYECGIQVANYNDIKVGDIIEFFDMEQVAG